MSQNQRPPHAVHVVAPGTWSRIDITQVCKMHGLECCFHRMGWQQARFRQSSLVDLRRKWQPAGALHSFFPVEMEVRG